MPVWWQFSQYRRAPGHCTFGGVEVQTSKNTEPALVFSVPISIKKEGAGAVLRWQRNRKGRPLSLTQIHQKILWMLYKFHKTTSECWRRTPGTQKGSPFSLKGGHLYLLPPSSLLCLTLWISLMLQAVENTQGTDYWLDGFSWLPLFSSWSPLSPSSFFSSPYNSVNLSGCLSPWRIFSPLT